MGKIHLAQINIGRMKATLEDPVMAGFVARLDWFEKFDGTTTALWWIPKGHVPSVDEAKKRLALLEAHGPTPFAFTFKTPFEPVIAPWPPASTPTATAEDAVQGV